jgi:DNA-binding transcriptional LysR family regulator
VELTPLGHNVLPALQAIDQEITEVRRRANALTTNPMPPLRLGVMCTIGPGCFVDAIAAMRMDLPGTDIAISDANSRVLVERLMMGELDVAISAWPTYPPRVEVHALGSEPFVLISSHDHAVATGGDVQFDAIRMHPYLQRLNCEFDEFYEAKFGAEPFDVDVVFASEREDWIQSMVAAGLGISVVPQDMDVLPGIVKHRLVNPEIARDISLLTLRDGERTSTAAHFVKLVKAMTWRPGAGRPAR